MEKSYMEKSLECTICLHDCFNPKQLPCLHTFCLSCLTKYCEEDIIGDQKPCPLCRRKFAIPQGGVEEFANDATIIRLLLKKRIQQESQMEKSNHCEICATPDVQVASEHFCLVCGQRFCAKCKQLHLRQKATQSHQFVNFKDGPCEELKGLDSAYCSQHKTKEIELYCCDCNELLCYTCHATNHIKHPCKSLSDIATSKKDLANSYLEALQSFLTESKYKMDAVERYDLNFSQMITESTTAVRNSSSSFIKLLNDYSDQLQRQFDEIKKMEQKEIEVEKDRHALRQTELDSFISYSKMVMERGTDCEIVRVADKLQYMADKLIESQVAYTRQKLTEKSGKFCASPAPIVEVIQDLVGKIQYTGEFREKQFEVSAGEQYYYNIGSEKKIYLSEYESKIHKLEEEVKSLNLSGNILTSERDALSQIEQALKAKIDSLTKENKMAKDKLQELSSDKIRYAAYGVVGICLSIVLGYVYAKL